MHWTEETAKSQAMLILICESLPDVYCDDNLVDGCQMIKKLYIRDFRLLTNDLKNNNSNHPSQHSN